MSKQLPVFFDPDQKRWPRLRRGVFLIGLILSSLFGVLIISILINPVLPALDLPSSSILPKRGQIAPPTPEPVLSPRQRALREAKKKLELERRMQQITFQPNRAATSSPGQMLTIGFFVNWDDSSMSSLKENLASLDILIPEWLHLSGDDGTVTEDDPTRQHQVIDFLRAQRPELRIMPLINNFDGTNWQSEMLRRALKDAGARAHIIDQLLAYVQNHNLAGISVDFESIPDDSQPAFNQFLSELVVSFHSAGLAVSVNVPVKDPAFDYAKLSRLVDYVILMAYDQHWPASKPGPVSGLDWFAQALLLRQADVPAQKMIIAIGNYAYDWQGAGKGVEKTFEMAVLTAKESEADIRFDPESLNPTFEYEEEDGKHQVWMLDAVTAFNQVVIAQQLAPRGFALWRLGSEDPAIWQFFGKSGPLNAEMAKKLEDIRYGYGLDYEGRGEILRISAQPARGKREIAFDADRGLITSERFAQFPSPYVITRYGAADHKIALTFDDGPDPDYTGKILDTLREAKVPATFFVIGLNGERYPDLLRRMIAEGHEIGNHTFTHPNIANIPETQFRLELSATQRLFESVISRKSYLFRPPYAEDAEPDTPDQVRPLEIATERGYITVGMQIDPRDWKRPGVEAIVQSSIEQAEDQNRKGNIILLHDSGGDRSQTLAALPILIEELRRRGYQFVTVSKLLGKSRDELMPPISATDKWRAWSDRAAFALINFGIATIYWLFLIGIVLGIARLIFIGTLAIYDRWRKRHTTYDPNYAPTVAVILPAYNEEKVIVQTVTSLLECDHPQEFEIIVVDDGSTDNTAARVREAFADEPRVRLFTKPNGGKASALNFAVMHTSAEIVIALDADTIFARDCIGKLVRHFADPKIGAVAGNAKVGNRINLLTRWQALEYITSQNLDRRAFNVLNCITVVPGAVGAWRRSLVLQAGGFTDLTLAEDADLTMAIRKLGYSIVYEDEAIGLTEAPDNLPAFIRQRYRWMYGTLQAAWRHRDALFRPRLGSLGFIALPNIFIFQVFFPLISPAMDLLMGVSLAMTAFDRWQHPDTFSAETLWRVLFYYALFMAADFLAAALAFLLEKRENRRLLVWLFWQRFLYRQLMYYVAIKSVLASLRGIAVGWNKLERKATVKA
jgi:cellulose synthase/poly-beta-1,6-N-acetylglucosamine synthase-like glycosyltransferase/peptidoglycan/xylan/chitin deacetylase (PgdA/CDA1 family)/spore germination protein YaaH